MVLTPSTGQPNVHWVRGAVSLEKLKANVTGRAMGGGGLNGGDYPHV